MLELEAYRKAMKNLPSHILQAEAEGEKNDYLSVSMINGKPGGMKASDKTALFVKATGEKTGMTYTQNLEKDPFSVLEEAYRNSQFVRAEKPDIMLTAAYEPAEYERLTHSSMEELVNKAEELSRDIYTCYDTFSHVEVHITENIKTVGIVNSLGLDCTYSVRILEASVEVTSEGVAHRSLNLETSAPHLKELSNTYFTKRIKDWSAMPVNAVELPENDMRAVIDSTVMCNILLTAWQMFSGQLYAGHGTPFAGRLGEKLFSEKITLTDDPFAPDSGYGREFDCEGSSCCRTDVIKDGVFAGLLHNLSSAELLSQHSTGNAGRDVNLIQDQTEVRIIPSNFRLQPGNKTKEELLEQLQDGIYIFESFDMFHSVNIASGEFAMPCKGLLYRNQKVEGMVNGITISGNLMDLFARVEEAADDIATLSVVMSKSFQVMSPSILVSELHVTGGSRREEKM